MSMNMYIWPDTLISQVLKNVLAPSSSVLGNIASIKPDEEAILVVVEQSDYAAQLLQLRRRGFVGPILLLSFSGNPGEKEDWYAKYYDESLQLPCLLDEIETVTHELKRRYGKRKSVVNAAVMKAWEERFDTHRKVDHDWGNFSTLLRFLRGAQKRFAIHPEDAMDVIAHLGRKKWKTDPEIKTQRLAEQGERWREYKEAVARQENDPPRWMETESHRPFTLLAIDDQVESLGWGILFNRLLFQHGFEVVTDDGTDYRAAIDRHNPDAILLDLNFENLRPGDSLYGFTILADIREIDRTIPVILFSASETLALERKRQELGMVGYIVKSEQVESQDPVGYFDRLLELLRKAIEHRIRFHLNALCTIIETQNPYLFEAIQEFLRNALIEVDDYRASGHNAALAIEHTTRWLLRQAGVLSSVQKQNFDHFEKKMQSPWNDLMRIGRLLRNAIAHSALGAASFSQEDARLGCVLAVFLVAEMDGIRLSSYASDLVLGLSSLTAKRCADDVLQSAKTLPHGDALRLEIEGVGAFLRGVTPSAIPEAIEKLAGLAKKVVEVAVLTLPPWITAPVGEMITVRASKPLLESLEVWPPVRGHWELASLPAYVRRHASIEELGGLASLKLTPPATIVDPIQYSFELSFKASQKGHPADGLEISKKLKVEFEKVPWWTKNPVTVFTETGSVTFDLSKLARELYSDYNIQKSNGCALATVDPDSGSLTVRLKDGATEGTVKIQAKTAMTKQPVRMLEIVVSYPPSQPQPESTPFCKNLKLLQGHFQSDDSSGDDLRQGFEHGGVVPFALLGDIPCLERYETKGVAEGLDAGAATVVVLLFARLVSWCVANVIAAWNPAKQRLYEHSKSLSSPVDARAFNCCKEWEAYRWVYGHLAKIAGDRSDIINEELEALKKKSNDITFRLDVIKQHEIKEARQQEQTTAHGKDRSPMPSRRHGQLTYNLGSLLKDLSIPAQPASQASRPTAESKENLEASNRETSAKIKSLEWVKYKLEKFPAFTKPYDIKMLMRECTPSHLTSYDSIERLIETWQSFEGEDGEELQMLLNEIVSTFTMKEE